jgi:anti-sigma factor RsiW
MTGRIIPLHGDRHRQIQALLPWYAAGALDAAETAEVRDHLAACAECQAELAAERRLTEEMRAAELEAGPAGGVDASWRRFRQAAAAERPRRPLPAFAPGWLRPGWLPLAFAAQACALVVVGAFLGRTFAPAPAYHALSAPVPVRQGNAVVVFRPETPERTLRQILVSGRARLVDGPTDANAYVIATDEAERAAVLARFRARPEVVLAEPVDPP